LVDPGGEFGAFWMIVRVSSDELGSWKGTSVEDETRRPTPAAVVWFWAALTTQPAKLGTT
jgi:hypothetical protein